MFRARPSLFLLIAIVGGIVLADKLHLVGWIYLAVALFSLVGAVWIRTTHESVMALLLGVSILFGSAFHFDVRYLQRGPYDVANIADGKTKWHLYGQVDDWPTLKRNRTECIITIDSVSDQSGRPVNGKLLLRLSTETTALQRGDGIEFYSRIYPIRSSSLPGQFDYGRFLNLKEVHGTVNLSTLIDVRVDRRNRYGVVHQIDKLRDVIRSSLYRNLDSISAALAAGFMIGETHDIPDNVYTLFRDTGTLHLLAVSGSNVAIVLLFMIWLLRPFAPGRGWRTVILLLTVSIFSVLSYGEPSVLRASVMATLVILASFVQRRYDLNNIVMLAASIILIVVPSQLYNVGFQLSFVTAWGLIIATPYLHSRFKRYHTERWYRWLMLPLLIALTAQLFSMPVIAYYFGVVPVMSVPANLIIVPLVSIAVVGILLVLSADIILSGLGLFVGGLLNLLLRLILYVLEFFGGDNTWVVSTGNPPLWTMFVAYGLVLSVLFSLSHKFARRMIVWLCVISLQIVLINAVVYSMEAAQDAELLVTRVPGGSAVLLLQLDNAEADLILSGLASKDYDVGERVIEPLLESVEVSRISRLFVLTAEFGAIDDILNLARSKEVDSVFVSGKLHSSFLQVLKSQNMSGSTVIIKLPATLPDLNADHSIFASSAGIVIRQNEIGIAIVPELTKRTSEQLNKAGIQSYVIDRLTSKNVSLIRSTEISKLVSIICSYLAQDMKADVSKRNSVGFGANMHLFELSRISPLQVWFNPSAANTVQISVLQ